MPGTTGAPRPRFQLLSSAKGRIIGGFALLGVIVVAAAVVSAWQASVHNSKSSEADSRSANVALLQNVGEEAGTAAMLLQDYVVSGDDTLIAEIQSHSSAAVGTLAEAAAQSDAAGMDEIAAQGASLAEGGGQIVALRLSGDVQGAAAAIAETAPAFEQFNLGLAQITEQELQEVAALQDRADRAGDLAMWFLIVSVAGGATLGLGALALIARSLVRRRVSKPAPL